MKICKASFLFTIALLTAAFSIDASEDHVLPEYCAFINQTEEDSSISVVTLDGASQVEPIIAEEFNEFQLLLQRADNGRGNGIIRYSNPALPIGDSHNYVIFEDPPVDGSRIFPGIVGKDGELKFEIFDLDKRGYFSLNKVLTIEEVEACNKFLEEKIDLDSYYIVDGLVYLPIEGFGIKDIFAIGIKATNENTLGINAKELNSKENIDTDNEGNGNSNQNDGDIADGSGCPPDCEWPGHGGNQ